MSDLRELLLATATMHDKLAEAMRREAAAMPSANGHSDPLTHALAIHPKMGFRQQEVLQEVIKAGDEGTDMGRVQRSLDGITGPNVHLTLKRLVEWGFVRKDEHHDPQLYYVGDAIK